MISDSPSDRTTPLGDAIARAGRLAVAPPIGYAPTLAQPVLTAPSHAPVRRTRPTIDRRLAVLIAVFTFCVLTGLPLLALTVAAL